MRQYEDLERQQMEVLQRKQKEDMECVSCPKCGSQWFEEVAFYRYKSSHNVILGQNIPPRPGSIPYFLLRCVRCTNLLEPRVLHNTRDIGGNDYDFLLDTLEGKGDKRVAEEDQVEVLKTTINGLKERIELLENNKANKPDKKGAKQKLPDARVSPNPTVRKKRLEIPSEEQ